MTKHYFNKHFDTKDNQSMNLRLIEWDITTVLVGYGVERSEARRIGKSAAEEAAKNTKLTIMWKR